MTVTNAQIKTFLLSPSSPYPVNVRINDYKLVKGRWPRAIRVDIEQLNPEQINKDYKLKDIKQVFRVHLYSPVSGSSSDELVVAKQIQDIVRATLEAQQLAGTKLFREIFNWSQFDYEQSPFFHVHSYLDVTPEDIQSETGQGLIGAYITIDIGSLMGLQVLSQDGDEGRNSTRKADVGGTTAPIPEDTYGAKFIEVEYIKANFDTIAGYITAKNYQKIVMHEASNTRTFYAIPMAQRYSVRYDNLETVIIHLEIVSG